MNSSITAGTARVAGAEVSAGSPNSRTKEGSGTLEQQFLALIEESLGKLGLSASDVEIRLKSKAAHSEAAPKAEASGTPSFIESFKPTYRDATSAVVDVSGKVVGEAALNRHHFASTETAEALAAMLGAKVTGGDAVAVGRTTPELQLEFDGSTERLNAGLVARAFELAKERGESADLVIQRLKAELAYTPHEV
jgi:hypothetical protein